MYVHEGQYSTFLQAETINGVAPNEVETFYQDSENPFNVAHVAVPEPVSLGVLGRAVAAFLATRRRKARR